MICTTELGMTMEYNEWDEPSKKWSQLFCMLLCFFMGKSALGPYGLNAFLPVGSLWTEICSDVRKNTAARKTIWLLRVARFEGGDALCNRGCVQLAMAILLCLYCINLRLGWIRLVPNKSHPHIATYSKQCWFILVFHKTRYSLKLWNLDIITSTMECRPKETQTGGVLVYISSCSHSFLLVMMSKFRYHKQAQTSALNRNYDQRVHKIIQLWQIHNAKDKCIAHSQLHWMKKLFLNEWRHFISPHVMCDFCFVIKARVESRHLCPACHPCLLSVMPLSQNKSMTWTASPYSSTLYAVWLLAWLWQVRSSNKNFRK